MLNTETPIQRRVINGSQRTFSRTFERHKALDNQQPPSAAAGQDHRRVSKILQRTATVALSGIGEDLPISGIGKNIRTFQYVSFLTHCKPWHYDSKQAKVFSDCCGQGSQYAVNP